MSWPGVLATMVGWWIFCTLISVGGWLEGFVVGGVCFVVVVGMRLLIDRDDRKRARDGSA